MAGRGGGERDGDLTVPLDDSVDGVASGAREAIILGHPEVQYGEVARGYPDIRS